MQINVVKFAIQTVAMLTVAHVLAKDFQFPFAWSKLTSVAIVMKPFGKQKLYVLPRV